jgi:predicted DNA-binding protein
MTTKKSVSEKTTQVAVRLSGALLHRLDAAARKLSRPGLDITRADAIRIALETGLQSIEKESVRG